MTTQSTFRIKPYPLGAHVEDGAIRFSFVSKESDCGVLIYDRKTGRKIKKLPFSEAERIGNLYCKYLTGIPADKISYQFYEKDSILPDRRARKFVGKATYGKVRSERELKATFLAEGFDWEGDACPRTPYSESLFYCAHVRGFTRHPSSGVEHRGTYLGLTEKIDYLKSSGFTAIELQPSYEFMEMPSPEERKRLRGTDSAYPMTEEEVDALYPVRCNYWGYKEGYYYAPKAAYAATAEPDVEFKEMVKALHRNGLELIMQFYFPNSVRRPEIVEILKFWVLEYHVDGFHLMGEHIPVEWIATDAVLADTKLLYYHFDADAIYGQDTPAYCNLAACNDDYLYTMRKYLKGDENMLESVLAQMRHIPTRMGRVHYMSNYYGFTLMDMVSYERKHNEPNGENNRDGNDYNCSWNCGEEGASRRKKVIALRKRQIRNAYIMLMFSQSTPMIFMGDEFGNSQKGNNNPYCQDNVTTWLNWNDLEKNRDLYDFWKKIVALRKAHPILHPEEELKIMDYASCGYPDLSYHGGNAWQARTESYNRHVGIMYCGKYAKTADGKEDRFFYLAMNMYWNSMQLALPKLPRGMKWELLECAYDKCQDEGYVHVGEESEGSEEPASDRIVTVKERCISIYVSTEDTCAGAKEKHARNRQHPRNYQDRTMF